MIQSYKKILQMESVATLKLEQDKKALEKVRAVLYQDKSFIISKLIKYLQKEFDLEYFSYTVEDINNNIADILVRKESRIFKKEIDNEDYVKFDIEELIDSRMFDNYDEIIVLDINSSEKLINLGYLCESLDYKYLSYSENIKECLSTFLNYVLSKTIK